MKVTYYGHSCFLVEVSGKKLLFDPFITPNELARNIDVSKIKPDYILISHGHEDHVADALTIGKASGATFISNFEIVTWFNKQGIKNYQPMNLGGKWTFDFGTVKYVAAIHSSTLPDGSSGGNPGGFVIESAEGNFYYAGDTALTSDMQLIPRFTKLDFAMLPVGDCFTMGADDAMVAAEFVKCSKIIGMHYDTFGFIKIDHEAALARFTKARLELILMDIGETVDVKGVDEMR
jgi:L-ascorbate metabolism protein UlaG (beta-lactamase superfamily)